VLKYYHTEKDKKKKIQLYKLLQRLSMQMFVADKDKEILEIEERLVHVRPEIEEDYKKHLLKIQAKVVEKHAEKSLNDVRKLVRQAYVDDTKETLVFFEKECKNDYFSEENAKKRPRRKDIFEDKIFTKNVP